MLDKMKQQWTSRSTPEWASAGGAAVSFSHPLQLAPPLLLLTRETNLLFSLPTECAAQCHCTVAENVSYDGSDRYLSSCLSL